MAVPSRLCRLRYRLTQRVSEIMLLRGFTVSPGCIRHWEAHCMPDRSYRYQRYSPNF
jgi:hypothetical protein